MCTITNGLYSYMLRNALKSIVTKIELDVDSEQFVIFRPQTGFQFKERVEMIPFDRLEMKPNMPQKDCLYYDKESGEGLATVNKG